MNILLFNNTMPDISQNPLLTTKSTTTPSSGKASIDISSSSSQLLFPSRLIQTHNSSISGSGAATTVRRTSLENYKLKPIEQIQQQIAINQYTVNNYEKFFMLKIKCKCIHILNRLISLVSTFIFWLLFNFKIIIKAWEVDYQTDYFIVFSHLVIS